MTLILSGSDGVTFPDSTEQETGYANGIGFRNRIINGDMRIDQRFDGASTGSISGGAYTLDRWLVIRVGGTSTLTIQRSTTAPVGFTNSLLVTAGSGATPAGTEERSLNQRIEGFNSADLGWGTANAQTVTLSFWVRSSVTGTFGVVLGNAAFNRSFVASYAISAANTWEYKTVIVPGDTSGTWTTTNGVGISVYWDLGVGTTYSGSATGVWQGSGFEGLTGGTKLSATTGATLNITGVQLEVGSVATPFERRPYGTELSLCQRYCYVMGVSGATVNQRFFLSGNASGTNAFPIRTYPVTMRASPSSMTVSNVGHFTFETWASSQQTCTGLVLNVATENETTVTVTVGSSLATGGNVIANNAAAKITISAEL